MTWSAQQSVDPSASKFVKAVNYVAAQLRISRKALKSPKVSVPTSEDLTDKVSIAAAQRVAKVMTEKFGEFLDTRLDKIMDATVKMMDVQLGKMDTMLKESEKHIKKTMTEQIDEARTTTLVFMYDAVNDCDARVGKLIQECEEAQEDHDIDIETLNENMVSLKRAVQKAFDETTGGRIAIETAEWEAAAECKRKG